MTEFQSHEPEFDYLKSFEIEEKINKVRWVNHPSASRLILSTNDKTITLWKVCLQPAVTHAQLPSCRDAYRSRKGDSNAAPQPHRVTAPYSLFVLVLCWI